MEQWGRGEVVLNTTKIKIIIGSFENSNTVSLASSLAARVAGRFVTTYHCTLSKLSQSVGFVNIMSPRMHSYGKVTHNQNRVRKLGKLKWYQTSCKRKESWCETTGDAQREKSRNQMVH